MEDEDTDRNGELRAKIGKTILPIILSFILHMPQSLLASHRPPSNLLLPQIHHLLPPITPLRTPKYPSQTLDTTIELLRVPLMVKVERHITHFRSSHAQQTFRHGQIHPRLARVGQDAALLAARLEEGRVFGAGEDEDGLERLERDEGADDGGWHGGWWASGGG